MGQYDSRIARVLSELADLGRRIGERADELATLAGKGRDPAGPESAVGVADVAASAAELAASAGNLAGATQRSGVRNDPAVRLPQGDTPAVRPPRAESKTARSGRNPAPKRTPSRATSRALKETSGDRTRRGHRQGPYQPPPDGGRRARPAGPVLVSTVIHLVVLIGLAMMFVARDAKPERFVITSAPPEEEFTAEFTPLEFEATESTEDLPEEASDPSFESLDPLLSEPVIVEEMPLQDDLLAIDASDVVPVAFDSTDMLAAVGGGAGESAAAGGGRGGGGGGGPAGAPTFFGRQGQGKSVCFVCDNSNSYRDGGFHAVIAEVARAVDALQPSQSFFVIFFSDTAYPMFHPDQIDTLQPATRDNKQRLQAWLGTVEMCTGGQGIHDAVKLATELGAEVVYFLSDGDHAASVVDRVTAADFGDTVVHTFGMQQNVFDKRTGAIDPGRVHEQQAWNQNLIDIATAHGGTFTPVLVPPQAAALEQMRPIRKNRSRGAIWGLKL